MNQVIAVVLGIVFCCAFIEDVNSKGVNGKLLEQRHLLGLENIKFSELDKEIPKKVVENLLLKVFVVIDFSLYQRWLELEDNDVDKTIDTIRYFYAHVVNGISEIFSRIDTGPFRYKVALIGYYIAQTLDQSSFTESEDVKREDPEALDFEEVLFELEEWVAERTDVIKNYGVVVAFTRYKDPTALAVSSIKDACTNSGHAIITSRALYSTIRATAHEIGHTLGSEHDGYGNDCDPYQYYLMTPGEIQKNITNYHTFSSCSRDYLEKFITSLKRKVKENCFRVEAIPLDDEVQKYLAELPGQRFTPDQQCQQEFGPNSFCCSNRSLAHLEICQNVFCFNSTDNRCYRSRDMRGLDGTSCGNKSWCLDKQCVYDDRAPVRNEYCMFGETKHFIMYKKQKYFCSDLLEKPHLCYKKKFEQNCCETCPRLAANESVVGQDHLLDQEKIGFSKRESPEEVVENLLLKVFVVIDFSLYQRWLELEGNVVDKAIANIRYFYAHVVDGVSKKYISIETGPFRYKVVLTGYYIAQTLDQSLFTESEDVKTENPEVVNFSKVLWKLVPWIAERAEVIKNDGVVVVFTKYKGPTGNGKSNVESACTKGGVSLVQSLMLDQTISLAAHEVGHTLGSNHDGAGNDCDPKENFLMTPKLIDAKITNYHTFSRCSRASFEKYINSLTSTVKENCFRVEATPMDEEVKKYLAELPGLRFTPDQSCQQQFGLNSYYCSKGAAARLEICQHVSCFDSKNNQCYSRVEDRGLEGTSCGNKSWCLNKQCVYDDRAPVREEFCMFGENRFGITINAVKYFCSDILKERSLCKYDAIKNHCCETCSNPANNGSAK